MDKKTLTKTFLSAAVLISSVGGLVPAIADEEHTNQCAPYLHDPMMISDDTDDDDASYYKIQLNPPQDPAFRDAMGGKPVEMSMNTLMGASGTMFVVAFDNGRTDITFDFHHLLPMGVYSLWNVLNPNYQAGEFADAPLPDQTDRPLPVMPGFLGAPEGYGRHAFVANKCGSANFKITMFERPGQEFLLDFHANDFDPNGVKGHNLFPGVLWGKFPQWH